MPAYVVLELAPSPRPRAARGQAAPLSRADVQRLLKQHQATLLPASAPPAGAADPTIYTTIAVPDMARAQALADALREIDGVASAYAKPGEALP